MRSFDENLNAYFALNAIMDMKAKVFKEKLVAALTIAERQKIMEESRAYFREKETEYKALGEEMVKIMAKHWWEFWK